MDDLLLTLAPPAVAGRAAGIAVAHKWKGLCRAEPLVWGRYRGADWYEVAVDLATPAYRCTCPVRKQPCKHSLALHGIALRQPGAFSDQVPSPELVAWREQAARPREAGKARSLPTSASRQEREALISAGIEDLERWLRDLVRTGIAALPTRPYAVVEEPARRLVDAKAPGLAAMVRDLGASAATGAGWQERVVERIGRLHLLIEAWHRRDEVGADLRADITSLAGIPVYQQQVLEQPAVSDRWDILGEQMTDDDSGPTPRRTLRTWMWGGRTRQPALLLQFEFFGQQIDRSLVPGHQVDADLCYYPSAFPLRVVVKTRQALQPLREFSGFASLRAMHAFFLDAIRRQPWIDSVPVPLAHVFLERREEALWLSDHEATEVPVVPWFQSGWELLATGGGGPIGLFGEWNGRRFSPVSAWSEDRLIGFGSTP